MPGFAGFYDGEPILVWTLILTGNYFNLVPTVQCRFEWDNFTIDFSSDTMHPHISMNGKRKIDWRCPPR